MCKTSFEKAGAMIISFVGDAKVLEPGSMGKSRERKPRAISVSKTI